MKFSLLYELEMPKPWTPRREYETYWEALAQIQLADEVGFDTVWEVEHHFLVEYSHSSAPEVFLAAASQRTRTIRIGHGVTLLPFPYNHPIRVAERVAALDIVSNGRVEFGTGRSVTEIELGGFQVNPDDTREMWEEALEVIIKAWKTDPLEHEGKRLKIPPRTVVPKPIQQPHPPIWLAATGPDSFSAAGERGLGALCFNFSEDQALRNMGLYRKAVANATPVGQFINNQFAQFFIVHCGTDEDTKTAGVEAARWFLQKVTEILITLARLETKTYGYLKDMIDLTRQPKDASVNDLWEHPLVVVGDPERCIRKLEKWENIGIDEAICFMQAGRLPHQRVMDSIKLFGQYVIPYFKPWRG
ncbi:MAG: LLM class flavin-dependent oxidoreductase [Thermodesulfobacteriota bacterium]|jgi:alkanesulfonate monooxygenase SsuD/methylene tetrahydromethanopterin reductase-like flavin-dependent oxidoreductase (luciferase family)